MSQSTNNLLPFQKAAVNTALAKKKMLINLPAGSGKTLIALEVAQQSSCKRVLVVCPAFLRLNCLYEVRKWFPELWEECTVIESIEDSIRLRNLKSVFAVVGYSYFQKEGEGTKKKITNKTTPQVKVLQKQHWDLVVCDESHYLRRWESQRCRDVVLRICRMRDRLLFMSATPLVTSAADLHPTFAIMQPGRWENYGAFKKKFCIEVPDVFTPGGVKYVGMRPEMSGELKRRAREFVFTARKKDVLKQLPEKRVIDLPVNVGTFEQFDDDIELYLETIINQEDDENDEIKTERERIGKAKIPSVLELLQTFPTKEQIVIFAWHRSVAEEITNKLGEDGESVSMIIGGMSESARMDRVIAFQKGKIQKLVVSIAAGGLGLNLQNASIAVFAELPYSYSEFEQCSDRVHRIGSVKRVRIYKVVAVSSLDEHINRVIEVKRLAAENAGVAT